MKGAKKRRDALIALAQRRGWEIGYLDEVWWSRLSQPNMHSWSEQDEPLRLQELSKDKDDPDRHPPWPVTEYLRSHASTLHIGQSGQPGDH